MSIVSLQSETFDRFLLKSHEIFKEDIVKTLERYDYFYRDLRLFIKFKKA